LFQTKGFASKYCFPFANEVCVGIGYDIGCMKKEWAFPGAIPIDLTFDNGYHATNLPDGEVDYIFSSHCLEHINDWVGALDYWGTKLKKGGVIFLYLPDYSQEYWRPWNNRKHINILTPEYLKNYFEDKNFEKVFVSGVDLNNSFIVMVEK
jgi:predicted SAM-dependent methyltransferase